MPRATGKKLTVLCAAGCLLATTALPAAADSGTGTQNPDLTVVVSLASSALDPDRATVGDQVTVTERVTNNTGAVQMPRVVETTKAPGEDPSSTTSRVRIAPHHSYRVTYSYRIAAGAPAGQQTLTVAATNGNGTSSATAEITVV
jgi:hypothetical protein